MTASDVDILYGPHLQIRADRRAENSIHTTIKEDLKYSDHSSSVQRSSPDPKTRAQNQKEQNGRQQCTYHYVFYVFFMMTSSQIMIYKLWNIIIHRFCTRVIVCFEYWLLFRRFIRFIFVPKLSHQKTRWWRTLQNYLIARSYFRVILKNNGAATKPNDTPETFRWLGHCLMPDQITRAQRYQRMTTTGLCAKF